MHFHPGTTKSNAGMKHGNPEDVILAAVELSLTIFYNMSRCYADLTECAVWGELFP